MRTEHNTIFNKVIAEGRTSIEEVMRLVKDNPDSEQLNALMLSVVMGQHRLEAQLAIIIDMMEKHK